MLDDSLSEEDVKNRYISPAIFENAKWKREDCRMEYSYTDGRIYLLNQQVCRHKRKKVDYLLFRCPNNPIAVVEAKDMKHSVDYGLQQGMQYAEDLDVPYIYASNGTGFVEHDMLTGKECYLALNEFPTKAALWQRYQIEKNLSPKQLQLVDEPYYSSRDTYPPRYYQRIAINKSVNAIANGSNRVLLVMATGTGKTYTAFQIVYRLLMSGIKKRILYLADRNLLVDQAMTSDFSPLLSKATKVKNHKMDSSYQLYFALYQQLIGGVDDKGHEPFRQFQPNFFDMVVIDEAHRGSASEDSEWRRILEYFDGPNVTHFGMTATPKNDEKGSNINYFGKPIYTYSLKQGIDDGFLAPYRLIRVNLDIDVNGYRPHEGEKDINGKVIENKLYTTNDFDRTIVINQRTKRVAQYISDYLKKNHRRFDKTIIFCEDTEHARRMRNALVAENTDLIRQYPNYVMQITGDEKIGKAQLSNFEDVAQKIPTLVTTSKLLTTGVNVKTCKLIVLDQPLNSMIEFKQIIGRGTRIDVKNGKEFFTIMDFRGVSRLFSDPDFDGEPMEEQKTPEHSTFSRRKRTSPSGPGRQKFYVDNQSVKVINDYVEYLDKDGHLVTTSLRDYTKKNILQKYATLDLFLKKWHSMPNKNEFLQILEEEGIYCQEIIADEHLQDMDPFDLILYLAYDQKPLTKTERVNHIKKSKLFSEYKDKAREVISKLLDKYKEDGIIDLESRKVLSLPEFECFGSPLKIALEFGGPIEFDKVMQQVKEKLYE